ncbi:trypsin-like peptidase domain-containing protein [Streptomyces sp. GMY02]|uniref:VMAP-C domain-containing protein n=1 Tax=Streptomyces sp. GMY02 TaxID=1333528 RepID=UPI0020B8C469|nr:trypsin-like peptidase domain-containing protein [Streptomyces sp. GMY02]
MIDGFGRGVPGASEDTRRALLDLVMAATVRIHGPAYGYAPEGSGGGFLGSGFFIAPSWVLTCAHVAMGGEGRDVTVVYELGPGSGETSVEGSVVAALPEPPRGAADAAPLGPAGGWPAPDLALIRLRRPVEHACVYVTERPAAYFGGGQVVYSGWTEVGGRLKRLYGQCSVQGTVGGWADPDEQMRLGGDVLPPGVSGGPTVDLTRGEVVGVLKSQLVGGMGGTSIGIERLRLLPVPPEMAASESDDDYQAVFHAHDRYHADRHTNGVGTGRTWADVQSGLGAGADRALSPQQRMMLLGRLAELPPPVSTHSLLDLLVRLPNVHSVDRYPAPRSWRDGLGALYENRGGEAALELVLRYCMSVIAAERPYVTPSTAAAEEALWNWVKWIADDRLSRDFRNEITRLRSVARHRTDRAQRRAWPAYGERRVDGEGPFVLLELEPRGWERDSYDWRIGVARHTGEVLPVREDSRGTPGQELPARLAAPLTEAFRRCDEPDNPAVLQVAVVQALLGLDVDRWQLAPGGPPLGTVRPVVVRPSDREPPYSEDEARERRARWNRTWNVAMRAEILDCEDGLRVPVPMEEDLRALAYEAVPVLCRFGDRPDAETAAGLTRMALGGFHLALLRRGAARPDPVCADFHRRAADTLAGAGTAGQLPRTVQELRRGVREGRTETYWSDGVALYYDDPHHPLPGSGQLLEAP